MGFLCFKQGVESTLKYISLLGATGSIGKQTVDIIMENKEKFTLVAMSVGKNIQFSPKNYGRIIS